MRYLIDGIKKLIHWVNQKRYTRRCRGACSSESVHTHHLTRAGLRHYTKDA